MDSHGHVGASQALNEDQTAGVTQRFLMCDVVKYERSIFDRMDTT